MSGLDDLPGIEQRSKSELGADFYGANDGNIDYSTMPGEVTNNTLGLLKNGLLTLNEILSGTKYLLKPFFYTGSIGTFYGESGTYKSFFMLDVGLSVAFGVDFHGYKVHQGGVIYICGEGQSGIGKRIKAWCLENGIDEMDAPFYVTKLPVSLTDELAVAGITDDIKKTCDNPSLIIIDTLSANFGDGDESSNADMGRLLNNITVYFRELGSCVVFVHHVGHSDKGRERGAYSLRANVDFRIQVERVPDSNVVTIYSKKAKDAAEFHPVSFKSKVINIPELYDSEGHQETSVVLDLEEYNHTPEAPQGAAQVLALKVLTIECEIKA